MHKNTHANKGRTHAKEAAPGPLFIFDFALKRRVVLLVITSKLVAIEPKPPSKLRTHRHIQKHHAHAHAHANAHAHTHTHTHHTHTPYIQHTQLVSAHDMSCYEF